MVSIKKTLFLSVAVCLAICFSAAVVACDFNKVEQSDESEGIYMDPDVFFDDVFQDSFLNKNGNDDVFSLNNTPVRENSPIKGKTFYFLGSSVTYGASSKGISMADYISKRNDCVCVKEAVSGTTLANRSGNSYVARLKNFDTTKSIDGFICQLSTNDKNFSDRGFVTQGYDIDTFDTYYTYDAMQYIIAYVKQNWNCPIYFYTGSYFQDDNYDEMVAVCLELAKKWDIKVINLYDNKPFNDVTKKEYKLFMADPIHPTQAGYRFWWVPFMERKILENIGYTFEKD